MSPRKRRRPNALGTVRQLPSGRWQASYRRDTCTFKAPRTFSTKEEGNIWLAREVTARARAAKLATAANVVADREEAVLAALDAAAARQAAAQPAPRPTPAQVDCIRGGTNVPPEPVQPMPSPAPKSGLVETIHFDTETGEVIESEPARAVIGLDGKRYEMPAQKPRQQPLGDAARSASADLARLTDRIRRIVALPLDAIGELDSTVTPDEAKRLALELSRFVASINRVIKLLKGRAI